ncbi:MAG: hypothetical protein JO076_06470 [Verrucomicrobia bacterium]|nr:hypothetical protein [Verrucomicrobiota bacterium]
MLTESDLHFVVESVATKRRDYDHIVELVRDKDDLLEQMLKDPRIFQRLSKDEKVFVRISPYLLFLLLLIRLTEDLKTKQYVFESDRRGKQIPVFEASSIAEMLSKLSIRNYLAEMLASFARTSSGAVRWKERGSWHKRSFSDMDIDDLIELARISEPETRPSLFKRVGDVALFVSGIFPECATIAVHRSPQVSFSKRSLVDYEKQGKSFYILAARHTNDSNRSPIFTELAERFTTARRALNTLSDHFIKGNHLRFFPDLGGGGRGSGLA